MRGVILCGLVFLGASSARAEGLALRAPQPGRAVHITGGWPTLAVAGWLKPWLGLGIDVRLPLSAVAADVAFRHAFVGSEAARWSLWGLAGAGVLVPTLSPGLAVEVPLMLQMRYQLEVFGLALDVSCPAALRLTQGTLFRAPLLLELWLSVRMRRFFVGGTLGLGATLVSGIAPSPAFNAAVTFGYAL